MNPDDLFGSGSFLGSILGIGQGGGGPFGSLGGGTTPAAAPASPPLQLDPSTVGPGAPAAGAPLDISASGPGNAGPGLWSQIASKLGLGGGGATQPQSQGQKFAGNMAQQLMKPAPIQTPQFQWLPPAGPR